MFRMSEGERIDRSSLLMRGGQAAPLKLSPEGAGHAPPPPAPPPMKGVNHPLQTTPAHTDAAPGRGRGLSLSDCALYASPSGVKDCAAPPIFSLDPMGRTRKSVPPLAAWRPLTRSLTPLGYSVDTFRSGSSGASLPRRPLRTGRADRPASGSSHYSAPRFGTGPLCGRFRGSTMGEVFPPFWIERIRHAPDFDVSLDRDRCCPKEPIFGVSRAKIPVPVSVGLEVPILHPLRSFLGMPSVCPFPEHLPDAMIYRREGRLCRAMSVIHGPSPNDRV